LTDNPTPPVDLSTLRDIDIEEELTLPEDRGQERTIARRLALQILYEIDSSDHPTGSVTQSHLARYALQQATTEHTVTLVNGVSEHIERLDMIIQTIAQDWPLDQVAIVDRNILRIAVFEYGILARLPVGVVTDEAVKLARLFGSDSSMRFINGVLGSIFENKDRLKAMLEVEIPDTFDDEDEEYEYDEDEVDEDEEA